MKRAFDFLAEFLKETLREFCLLPLSREIHSAFPKAFSSLQMPQDDGENNTSRALITVILSLYGEESASLKY